MTLVVGVLVASLLGSVHCAAMCGAFTCLYAAPARRPNATSQLAYNGGRLVSYLTLGLLAGAFGGGVEAAGQGAGVANLPAILAGTLMMAWAMGVFAVELGIRVPFTVAPESARKVLGRVLLANGRRSAATRAFLLGLLTTLLPCGWLYTFVVVAAGTASPLRGVLVMLAFWAGTVPMLLAVTSGVARLLGPFARRMPLVSAAVVLTLGALSIAGRLHAPHGSHTMMHVGTTHVGR